MRIGTWNVENLSLAFGELTIEDRIPVMRPNLERMRADVLCLQELLPDPGPDGERTLAAFDRLRENTRYADYPYFVATRNREGDLSSDRILGVLSRYPVVAHTQVLNDYITPPTWAYQTGTSPGRLAETAPSRPIQHVRLALVEPEDIPPSLAVVPSPYDPAALADVSTGELAEDSPLAPPPELADAPMLDVINLHFKSKRPSSVPGERDTSVSFFKARSVAGWAEGFFLSSVKRVSQALEARLLVDRLISTDPDARIIVAGDFNADTHEVPVEAITGRIENTQNAELVDRELIPLETSAPQSVRYSLVFHGRLQMIDHLIATRNLLTNYVRTEIYNEALADETIEFAFEEKYPDSDHAPVVAEFVDP